MPGGAGRWLFPWTDSFSDQLGDGFKGTVQFLWGVGMTVSLVYAVGVVVIGWAPDTTGKPLAD